MATSRPSSFSVQGALLALFAGTGLATSAAAQCEPAFVPGDGTFGFWLPNGTATVTAACAWDPDGPGSAGSMLVCAGLFTVAGDLRTPKIATYDLATRAWGRIGNGLDDVNVFTCLLPLADGRLIAGGSFATVDGVPVNGLALWDGSWRAFGTGPGPVRRVVQLRPGEFVTASTNQLRHWNGHIWQTIGNTIGEILVLEVAPNGDLLVGGDVNQVAGVTVNKIARWDGATWSGFPHVLQPSIGPATALLPLANGDLVAAVSHGIQRFDSQTQTWSLVGPAASWYGLSGAFVALQLESNGDLVAIGTGSPLNGPGGHGRFVWDGTDWQRRGPAADQQISCTAVLPQRELFLGGRFRHVGTQRVDGGAIWDGTDYRALDEGTVGTVLAIAPAPGGGHIAAGNFPQLAGVACNHVARRVGGTWLPLGDGVDDEVHAAVVLPSGDVVVGGMFQHASGLLTRHIARWNGTTWLPLSSGCNWFVHALAVLPDGDLIAGGDFTTAGGVAAHGVARWDGSQWHALGSGVDVSVAALCVTPTGDLIVGGQFSTAGGQPAQNVARWDGSQWHALGGGLPGRIHALAALPNGDLLAAGDPVPGQGLWRWDGTAWTTVARPTTYGRVGPLVALPNGDVVASTDISLVANDDILLVRWNGANWSPVGAGFDLPPSALALAADGTLLAGGAFTIAADLVSAHFAEAVPTCPAQAATYGAGCATAAGTMELAATQLAWLGGGATFAAAGVPATAFGLGLTGFAPVAIQLDTLLPAAGPGCTLLTPPDIVATLLPGAGNARWTVAIPPTPSLVGTSFHSQLLAAEFGATGLAHLGASNAVTSTIGSL